MSQKKPAKGVCPLLRPSETDRITTMVIDSEVLPKEDVTDNPECTAWNIDVKASERADTSALNFKNVVAALERVGFAIEIEAEFGKFGNLAAVDSVLPIPRLRRTDPRKVSSLMLQSITGKTY